MGSKNPEFMETVSGKGIAGGRGRKTERESRHWSKGAKCSLAGAVGFKVSRTAWRPPLPLTTVHRVLGKCGLLLRIYYVGKVLN